MKFARPCRWAQSVIANSLLSQRPLIQILRVSWRLGTEVSPEPAAKVAFSACPRVTSWATRSEPHNSHLGNLCRWNIQFTHLCTFLTDQKIKNCHSDSSHRTVEWNTYCPKLMRAKPFHFSHAQWRFVWPSPESWEICDLQAWANATGWANQ